MLRTSRILIETSNTSYNSHQNSRRNWRYYERRKAMKKQVPRALRQQTQAHRPSIEINLLCTTQLLIFWPDYTA